MILDPHNNVLVVRKHGSQSFIQPGGKREPEESSLITLARELHEEIGVTMQTDSARRIGEFEAWAVNEPGQRVQAEVFLIHIEGKPQAQAEIAELAWIPLQPPHGVSLAPMSEQHILPATRALLAGDAAGQAR